MSGAVREINNKILTIANRLFLCALAICAVVSPISCLIGLVLGYFTLMYLERYVHDKFFLLWANLMFIAFLILEYFSVQYNGYIFYRYNFFDFFHAYFGSTSTEIIFSVGKYGILNSIIKLLSSLFLIDYNIAGINHFSVLKEWFFSINNFIFIIYSYVLFINYKLILPVEKKILRGMVATEPRDNTVSDDNDYKILRKMSAKLGQHTHPLGATNIGVTYDKLPYVISDEHANTHVLLVGTTGGGKSVTMYNFIEHAIQDNLPVIIIDGKGSRKLIDEVKSCAKHYNRQFKLFSLNGELATQYELCSYNPLAVGGQTELKEKMMELNRKGESISQGAAFYQALDEGFIQFVFHILILNKVKIDLRTVGEYLVEDKIRELVNKILCNIRISQKIKTDISEQQARFQTHGQNGKLEGIKNIINNFNYSQVGEYFDTSEKSELQIIDIQKDVIENNTVVHFSLAAGAFINFVKTVGEMVILDINAIFSKVEATIGHKKCYLIIDEFTAISSNAIKQTLSRNRSAGMHCILGTQGMSTIEADAPSLAQEIDTNHGIIIIHKCKNNADAEQLAQNIGTKCTMSLTAQVGEDGSTGMGSKREIREFLIHPDEIKRLKNGEAIIYNSLNFEYKRVVARYSRFISDMEN